MIEPRIYACVIGDKVVPGQRMFHLAPDRDPVRLIYPFWVLVYPDGVTLIDIGFPAGFGSHRGIDHTVEPEEMLAALSVDVEDVSKVIVSHLHFDHFTAPERFPNAHYYIQREDVEYFAGRGRTHPIASIADFDSVDALPSLIDAGRVTLLDGDARIAPGVSVALVGGHTPGSQITIVQTSAGPLVFACDASHFYENLDTRTTSAIYHDYDSYQRAFRAIETASANGRWFPGHDPLLLDELDRISERVYQVPVTRRDPGSS